MKYICHRVNTIKELKDLPVEYGVEIDLRDNIDGHIYLQHDPFLIGDDFEEYLKQYHHGTMILNIKSERVELKALELLKKYNITDYFFLDSSFPMIKLLSDMGEKRVALRFSEFEGMDTIRNMAGKVEWIWVDCFSKFPLSNEQYQEMKALGYKICFVSPELQGQGERVEEYKEEILDKNILFDAICSKAYCMNKWENEGYRGIL